MEHESMNIDDADISKKDENKVNECDSSINRAYADITNTVQTPHDTNSETIEPELNIFQNTARVGEIQE